MCNFSPQGRKGNVSSRPNTCHSPWWAVCLETASRPGLRSLTYPQGATGAGEADAKPRKEGKKKEAMPMFGVFLNRFSLMQDELHTLFCCRRSCCCDSPWQEQPERRLYPRKTEFKCPEFHWKVRQTRGFTFEYTGSPTDARCIWITCRLAGLHQKQDTVRFEVAQIKAELTLFLNWQHTVCKCLFLFSAEKEIWHRL